MIGDDLRELLGERIPAQPAGQSLADDLIPRLVRDGGRRVIDLGCGAGDSVEQFRSADPAVEWVGVDIERSPEVARRVRADAEFRSFDGANVPAEDGSADVVYCKQVLEHVHEPEPLVRDVARVLRPGGLFAGSTSQLEPFHSLSTFNYTPYGLTVLVEGAGLEMLELLPGIDALALILNRGVGMRSFTRRWWSVESPLNRAIGAYARARRLDGRALNAIRLLFCGQFAFLARRG